MTLLKAPVMDIRFIENMQDISEPQPGCVLTIGNFDGVHIGHQRILKKCRHLAEAKNKKFLILTFEPHPMTVLHPDKPPGLLNTPALKKHLFEQLGADFLFVLKSSPRILSLTASEFLERFLLKRLRPAVVVEGHDFNFGSDRTGNLETLKKMAALNDFQVVVIEPQELNLSDGRRLRVSSTLIREMLLAGNVTDAAQALGRNYRLIGKIIPGKGRGKKLGFPTLNMAHHSQLVPARSVYAGRVRLGQNEQSVSAKADTIPAVFSIGIARTFRENKTLLIEAHLLSEFQTSNQNRWMAMDFVQKIRDQRNFENSELLTDQIAKDCRTAHQILRKKPKQGG